MKYILTPELTLQTIGILISILILLKGINEFKKAQKWKKLEFLSKEIKEFFTDPDVKRALLMLDWNDNKVELKMGEIGSEVELYFNDQDILAALQTHKQQQNFLDKHIIIKKVFDALFDGLSMFENYIETGLVSAKDLEPYLNYWITILADNNNRRKSTKLREQMWKYIDEYGYSKVRRLCEREEFGSFERVKTSEK